MAANARAGDPAGRRSPALDTLIAAAIAHGELAGGVAPQIVARRRGGRLAAVAGGAGAYRRQINDGWTSEEDDFLRAHLGALSEAEIAERLGRTPIAVRLRWKRDLRLTAPSKSPDILTAEQIAAGLGMDSKGIHRLIDRGILPGRRLPWDRGRICRVVDRQAFIRWLVNPLHWIYFRPGRVGGEHPARIKRVDTAFWQRARRLVELRRARWDDEWWTPGQVEHWHGAHEGAANEAIRQGRLPATRYGNWWIRKSHATAPGLRLCFFKGPGGPGQDHLHVSPRADAFLVLAAAVGLTSSLIAPLLKWPAKRIDHRLRCLRQWRRLPAIIHGHSLPVHYNPRTGRLFADWRQCAHRFPRLVRALRRFRRGEELNREDAMLVRGVLAAWLRRYARTRQQRHTLGGPLRTLGRNPARRLRKIYRQMKAWGVDPLRWRKSERRPKRAAANGKRKTGKR